MKRTINLMKEALGKVGYSRRNMFYMSTYTLFILWLLYLVSNNSVILIVSTIYTIVYGMELVSMLRRKKKGNYERKD